MLDSVSCKDMSWYFQLHQVQNMIIFKMAIKFGSHLCHNFVVFYMSAAKLCVWNYINGCIWIIVVASWNIIKSDWLVSNRKARTRKYWYNFVKIFAISYRNLLNWCDLHPELLRLGCTLRCRKTAVHSWHISEHQLEYIKASEFWSAKSGQL